MTKYMNEYNKAIDAFRNKLQNMTCCADCPYPETTGFRDDNWRDRAEHVVGPCGQQHCWLEDDDDFADVRMRDFPKE
ncbi:hypothetical protein [uncultured Megasphaera sp.]|uniref:hypothetical protein n=1 Tax=uncultured Megasphaera sp. TaxID=165188 RepID=UPI00266D8ABA|nr:hypothetical protein [uncultured Megasphaera sp.]